MTSKLQLGASLLSVPVLVQSLADHRPACLVPAEVGPPRLRDRCCLPTGTTRTPSFHTCSHFGWVFEKMAIFPMF